jgi:hypothetical protein
MTTARAHVESLLRARKLDSTFAAPIRHGFEYAATGIRDVDAALGGGFRRGQLSEIVGPPSSGRTTVLCGTLAAAVSRGEIVALVDTADRFDVAAAAAAGLDLSKLLWIRERGDASRALKAAMLVVQAGGFGVVAFDVADVRKPALQGFPFTTWLRLARTLEGSDTVGLLIAADHLARSPGGVTLMLGAAPGASRARWAGMSPRARLIEGVAVRARVVEACEFRPTTI